MLQLIEKTNYYIKFTDQIVDRLDFAYNHPFFENYYRRHFNNAIKLGNKKILLSISNGFTPERLPDDSIYEKDKVLFIKNENVKPFKLDLSNKYYVFRTDFLNAFSPELHIKKGDILFSMTGTLGNAVLIREDIEATINQNVVILRFNPNCVDLEYMEWYLNSNFVEHQILRIFTSAQVPYMNQNIITSLNLILPEKNIQKKIVNGIRRFREEAEKLEKEYYDKVTKIYDVLLNKLNLTPVNTIHFFKSGSESSTISFYKFPDELDERLHYLFYHPKYEILEELKKKYRLVKLKDIVAEPIIRGEQPEYSEEGITVIKTVDLKNGYIDYENCLKVSEEFFEKYKEQHPEGVLRMGDILIASTGYVSMGKVDIYDRDEPAMVDGHISIVRLKSEYNPYFVTYYLRSYLGQIQFDKWWSGSSGQIEIQPQDLGEFLIPDTSEDGIPLKEQKEIANEITEKLIRLFELEKQAIEKWEEARKLFEKLVLEGIENEEVAE